MNCLVWCGFVQSRTEGRRTLYRVEDRKVRTLVNQARRFMEANEAQIACGRRIDAAADETRGPGSTSPSKP